MSSDGNMFSLGNDSKLIGRIFELISYDILREIAEENNFILLPSNRQTVYPDFTLMRDERDKEKIAVDIKSTYRDFKRDGTLKKYMFTLGSYASFMRNETKNIMFPYSEYAKHYIIGFIYTRNEWATEGQRFQQGEISQIPVPYKDVEFFVQEKYKISGEKPGSGNTENIGSYKTNNIEYLVKGEGPFGTLGSVVFEQYWMGYPQYRAKMKNYTSLEEYFDFCERNKENVQRLRKLYECWKMREK